MNPEAPPRDRLSPNAATWRLGWIGLGLLGAAVNTGNNLIYLTFSVLGGALLVSVAAALLHARRPRFELHLPSTASVGAPYSIDVSLTAGRRATLRGAALTLVTDQGELGPVFVERVARGATLRFRFAARGARRGTLRVLGVVLRSSHPLGLVERRAFHRVAGELLVLPCSTRAGTEPGSPRDVAGEAGAKARVAGTEYHGLRRGEATDDARKVDWKVTARRGVLIVRETTGEGRADVELLLATRVAGEPQAARLAFERTVERAAAIARRALGAGAAVRLIVDGGAAVTYAAERDQLRLLRHLARLEPTAEDGTALPAAPLPVRPGTTREPIARSGGRSEAERLHRAAVLVATAIGILALLAFEAVGAIGFTALAAGLIATAFFPRVIAGERTVAGRLWRIAAGASLAAFAADLWWIRRDLLAASSDLLVFVTLLALFTARTARDDRRLLLVSFVHVVLAAAMTTELAFALPFAAWLLAAVHASIAWVALPDTTASATAATGRPERARLRHLAPAAAWTAPLVAVTAVVFALLPHLGTGTFRPNTLRPQAQSGFSNEARLGDIGRIKLDRTKVMEVEVEAGAIPAEELRWRGLTLNRFDGRGWTRAFGRASRIEADEHGRLRPSPSARPAPPSRARTLVQEIRLEPLGSDVLFAAARPRSILSRDFQRLIEDGAGNLEFVRGPGRRLSYTVASELPPRDADRLRAVRGTEPEEFARPNLELPRLDPRIPALAREITAGAPTRYDAAVAIERWLSSRRTYSLAVDDAGVADPLARFLIDGAPGHCEYFATSMVVLARAVDLPARFVAGYLRGEKSSFGNRYVVRQSDAHAWVEIHFPGVGWVPFDPTPPAGRTVGEAGGPADLAAFLYSTATRLWDDYVAGVDLDDQARALLSAIAGARRALARLAAWPRQVWVGGLALALGTAFLGWVLARLVRRGRRARAREDSRRDVPSFYRQLLDLLGERGLEIRPGETPAELGERAGTLLGARGRERLHELTRLYYRVRYDGATGERAVRAIARALLQDVRDELRLAPAGGERGT